MLGQPLACDFSAIPEPDCIAPDPASHMTLDTMKKFAIEWSPLPFEGCRDSITGIGTLCPWEADDAELSPLMLPFDTGDNNRTAREIVDKWLYWKSLYEHFYQVTDQNLLELPTHNAPPGTFHIDGYAGTVWESVYMTAEDCPLGSRKVGHTCYALAAPDIALMAVRQERKTPGQLKKN